MIRYNPLNGFPVAMKHKLNKLGRLSALLRSLVAFAIEGVSWRVTASWLSWQTRLLVGWLAYALTLLGLLWWVIVFADARRTARQEDESRPAIFFITVGGALISLLTVIGLLGSLKVLAPAEALSHIILSAVTVTSSWGLIHSIFTLHYAHLYYTSDKKDAGGLRFPGPLSPDYLDFAYYSFVIGMTFQVSDVAVISRSIRRLTLVHSILSFAYNTLIIALTINAISSLL